MDKRILLTISILISNRPDTVRKCLDSIKPLLQKVPSELILVDTGCGEQVRGIIEEYTDKIVDFTWCRDFSKARNAGLEKAKGKWFLFLDDDEWFEDVTDIIRFFNTGEYAIYGVGLYTVRNYVTMEGTEYTDMLASRLIRLEPDIRFIHRIHECFNRAPGKAKRLQAFVHHYGYAHRTEEQTREHTLRNTELLLEEMKEHPRNMRTALQLAQEYNSIREREKSLSLSLQCIESAKAGPVEDDYCLASHYGNVINCYMFLYDYDEAIAKGEAYMSCGKVDRLVKAVIAGQLAIAFVDKENYGKALHYTKVYWNTYQEYLKNENAFIGLQTPVTDICFHERKRTPVLGKGVCAALRCGEAALAWAWFQDMNWQWEKYSLDLSVVRDILKGMPTAGSRNRVFYEKMCDVLLKRQDLEEFILEEILEDCKNYQDAESQERIQFASAYRNLPLSHWFLKLVRLAADAFLPEPGAHCSGEEAEAAALELWEQREETFAYMEAYHIPEAVKRLGGDLGHMLQAIPFSRWEKELTAYFGNHTWKETAWWAKQLEDAGDQDSMHMLAWRAACGISRASGEAAALEQGIPKVADGAAILDQDALETDGEAASDQKRADVLSGSIEGILEGLGEYANCRMKLCEKIYNEEIIRSMPDVLPEEYQGAYAIADLLDRTEQGKYAEAVEAVREIKKLLPGLLPIMKQYLLWLEGQMEQQKQEATRAAGEFQVLARQIKARIYTLMEAGQYQAALAVTEQVQALLPEDKELSQLREKLAGHV